MQAQVCRTHLASLILFTDIYSPNSNKATTPADSSAIKTRCSHSQALNYMPSLTLKAPQTLSLGNAPKPGLSNAALAS
jgi:hypothetical protein